MAASITDIGLAGSDQGAGGKYLMHIPADVPVANYWSLVLCDTETRCLVDNGAGLPSIASNQNLTLNAVGSADLHFGPEAPADGKELDQNCARAVDGSPRYVCTVRHKLFFDRRWTAGDITKMN